MESSRDLALALKIHQSLNNVIGVTENAVIPKNGQEKEYKPNTLIDNTLELIDPTPNIHTLFVQFNARYFWNMLLPVEVKWSNRMTMCAGVCSFHPRNQQCIITLSAPLLKLRPRKDLVETLLHEMIHGYLFLTNNNRDRDGHGPEFHKHMYRINKEAGTHISVYHDFHDEVKLYQQHWWRCDGPCQKRSPYFGMVRRAMNRAPGPNDNWWSMHQQTCGGKFVKVREPEKQPAKSKKVPKENGKKLPNVPKSKDISDWLTKPDKPKEITANDAKVPPQATISNPVASKSTKDSVPSTNNPSTFTKLGNTSNNIHGWGVGGPSNSGSVPSSSQGGSKNPKFHAAGVLGGSKTGRSNLLDKFSSPKIPGPSTSMKKVRPSNGGKILSNNAITDVTGTPNKRKSNDSEVTGTKLPKMEVENLPENTRCPVCDETVSLSKLNDHLDKCLISDSSIDKNQSTPKLPKNPESNETNLPRVSKALVITSPIVISDSSSSEDFQSPSIIEKRQKCLVCDEFIEPEVTLNDHLEACIGSAFADDSIPEFEENDENINDNQIKENSFPCPICMTFISESLMNQHLDTCLSKDLLKNYIE